jgi:uncharacterized protein
MNPVSKFPVMLRGTRLAVAFAVVAALLAPAAVTAQTLRTETVRTVTVTGEGGAVVVPDRATVALGVTHEADLAGDALRGMSAAMTAVLARLLAAGVAETDMQTGQLSLGPRWDYNPQNGQPILNGFTATTTVMVLVRDLDALGTILDAVVQDGANRLDGISFSASDDRAALDSARRAAVADARARAELYAAAAGVTLGNVLSIAEQVNYAPPMPHVRMAMEADQSVPIAAGEINLMAQVVVVYGIAD